jgi:hypothetical protein
MERRMRKNVRLVLLVLGAILFLQGCASGNNTNMSVSETSVKSVVDFSSAIRAYDATKKLDYLKKADTYASSESEKAILERKMVDYLGADKVFDVKISHKLSKLKGGSSSGFFGSSHNSKKNNLLNISISVNKNLPFTLKYNSYKLGIYLQRSSQYKYSYLSYHAYKNNSAPQITIKNENETIYSNRNILLTPKNNWSFHKEHIHDKVVLYAESSALATTEKTLIKLDYKAKLALVRPNIEDTKNHLIWQNSFQDTGGKIPFIPKQGETGVEEQKACKHLGRGWRVPLKYELDAYVENRFPKYQLDYWYYEIFQFREDYTHNRYLRCVKNTKPTFVDKVAKLEWDDDVYLSKTRHTIDAEMYREGMRLGGVKYCASRGNGWRLPTINEFKDFYQRGNLFKENKSLGVHFTDEMHYVTPTEGVFFGIKYDQGKYTTYINKLNNWGRVKCVRNIK